MIFNRSSTSFPQIEATLEACGFICKLATDNQVTPFLPTLLTTDEKSMSERILQTRRYDVKISSSSANNTEETYPFTIRAEQISSIDADDRDLRSRHFWKNNEYYRTSVRRTSNNSYFFPTTEMYNLTCGFVNTTYVCRFGSNVSDDEGASRITTPKNRFRTSLFLASNNVTSMILATGFSSWIGTKNGNGSAEMNATCSDGYTQVCPKCSFGSP